MIPNSKMTTTGGVGIALIIAMALMDQLAPGFIDFSQEIMGAPLNTWIVLGGGTLAGYFKTENRA